MRRLILQAAAVLALGVLFSACGEDPAPAAPPPPAKKAAAEAVAVAAPVDQVDYAYNPIGKRDPFKGLFDDALPVPGGGDPEPRPGCNEPLCLVDIDELSVVAVVSGDANPLAMVEDRSGVGYIVRRNTRVGKQGGKVTQVLRDCIVVTSFISGGSDGKPQANKQEMCVKSDKRSSNPLDLLKNKEFSP